VATDALEACARARSTRGPFTSCSRRDHAGTTPEAGRELVSARPELRVLYMWVHRERDRAHGVLDAETRFLQKPFTPAALALKVREVLGDVPGRAGANTTS